MRAAIGLIVAGLLLAGCEPSHAEATRAATSPAAQRARLDGSVVAARLLEAIVNRIPGLVPVAIGGEDVCEAGRETDVAQHDGYRLSCRQTPTWYLGTDRDEVAVLRDLDTAARAAGGRRSVATAAPRSAEQARYEAGRWYLAASWYSSADPVPRAGAVRRPVWPEVYRAEQPADVTDLPTRPNLFELKLTYRYYEIPWPDPTPSGS